MLLSFTPSFSYQPTTALRASILWSLDLASDTLIRYVVALPNPRNNTKALKCLPYFSPPKQVSPCPSHDTRHSIYHAPPKVPRHDPCLRYRPACFRVNTSRSPPMKISPQHHVQLSPLFCSFTAGLAKPAFPRARAQSFCVPLSRTNLSSV